MVRAVGANRKTIRIDARRDKLRSRALDEVARQQPQRRVVTRIESVQQHLMPIPSPSSLMRSTKQTSRAVLVVHFIRALS